MSISPAHSTFSAMHATAPLGSRTPLAVAPLRTQADSVSFGKKEEEPADIGRPRSGLKRVIGNLLSPKHWMEGVGAGFDRMKRMFKFDASMTLSYIAIAALLPAIAVSWPLVLMFFGWSFMMGFIDHMLFR